MLVKVQTLKLLLQRRDAVFAQGAMDQPRQLWNRGGPEWCFFLHLANQRTPADLPESAGPATSREAGLEPLDLQRTALLNNIPVRIALARYAATDAALRLEIARQVPELSLKPGYAWDQGDHRWSLGIGYALPLANRNDGPIAEALARRSADSTRHPRR